MTTSVNTSIQIRPKIWFWKSSSSEKTQISPQYASNQCRHCVVTVSQGSRTPPLSGLSQSRRAVQPPRVTDAYLEPIARNGIYAHKCDFYLRRFKTSKAVHIHRANCVHITVEEIIGVFNHIDTRFFLVKWEGYNEPEWE